MNYNYVALAGRLTREPALRSLSSGTSVCDFGLAVNRKWKDKEETTFVDVVAWGTQAELIAKHLRKGDPIFVAGRLTYEAWEDKHGGGKRSKLKITLENFQFVGGGSRDTAGGADACPTARSAAEEMADEVRRMDAAGEIPF